ncbi:hypothetical protein J2T09_003623 [Neorhizobium huautlense]|uniref:DUF3618 domain-containing protein n=1 Tax=Neorhizobium huautlense TaxID=67774 RepID=A0ABT9PXJ0_9HYPH|nr:hypothetical protein [Neorhizobium huautlense]MDP9838851.1 hypothetical protein [Neorhizobium huautlense]
MAPANSNVTPIRAEDALRDATLALESAQPRKRSDTDLSEVDAKIGAAEARTDTKFAELLGELRLMNQRLDHVEKSTSGMRSTVIGTGIGVLAVAIAVMAYGAQWFDLGMDAQQVSDRAVSAAIEKVQPQIDAIKTGNGEVNMKLDQLLQATRPRPATP